MSLQLATRPTRPTRSTCQILSAAPRPACVGFAGLFQHPLVEEPPRSSAPTATRRRAQGLAQQAGQVCAACPILQECLFNAVVKHDVAGFVAGTTASQRTAIRRRLGISVLPEDFETLAGVTGGSRQVNHGEVVRLRNAHPDESLERLARRLGCSLSTVKRHLRQERVQTSTPRIERRPSPAEVVAAASEVASRGLGRSRAA